MLWGREWQHCWGMLTRVTAYRSSHPAPGERMIESHTSIPPSSQPIIRRVIDRTEWHRCRPQRCQVHGRRWVLAMGLNGRCHLNCSRSKRYSNFLFFFFPRHDRVKSEEEDEEEVVEEEQGNQVERWSSKGGVLWGSQKAEKNVLSMFMRCKEEKEWVSE